MDYIIKNSELSDRYLFTQRKLNHLYIGPQKENKNTFYSFKINNNNRLNIPLNEKNNKSYNKNNKKGLHVLENELINLKREEAKHLFPKDYINENKKRLLNKKNYFQENSNSFKFKNSFFLNFPQTNINLENYYLKKESTHYYMTIPNMIYENNNIRPNNLNENKISNNELNLDNNKIETFTESSSILKNNNKNKNRENEIILPLNIEYKQKNYMANQTDRNFMEKYEYYLLNINKNSNQKRKKIQKENKTENKKIYLNTFSNFFKDNNNKDLQEIKPYKYKEYNLNLYSNNNNLEKGSLTSRKDTLPNCKYLTKYLDDTYTKKLINKNQNDKPKIVNKKIKKNKYLNNHFEEVLNKMERNILCVNEKNEDVAKRGAVSLLYPENEKMNNDINKNINVIYKIKNFSLKEESKELIPIINEVILNKRMLKNTGIQKSNKENDLNDKNRHKINLKELKVFDLNKNIKYGYKDNEEGQAFGNMLYNLINKKSKRRNRFFRNRTRIQIRYFSHLQFQTKLNIKSIKKLKRYKSSDDINNNENDSFYIPSVYNNRKKNNIKKPINNNFRNKSNHVISKTIDNNNDFFFNENLPKLYGDNLFNKTSRNKRVNFAINNLKNEKSNRRNKKKEDEGNELQNFLSSYKPKNTTNNKKEPKIRKNDKSKININDNNNEKNNTNKSKFKTNKSIIKEKKLNNKEEKNTLKNKKISIKITENDENKNINSNNSNNINEDDYKINETNNKSPLKSNLSKKNFTSKKSRRVSILSYNNLEINDFKEEKNLDTFDDKELSPIKRKNIQRKNKALTAVKFKKYNTKIIKYPKSPKRKNTRRQNIVNDTMSIEDSKNENENTNYIQLFNMLNLDDNKPSNTQEEQKAIISPKANRKKTLRFSKKGKNSSEIKKSSLSPKTFKDFKEENLIGDGEEEINKTKKIKIEEESQFKKKKSNLSKFKNIINKMKDMPIEEYMNYIENFFGHIDKKDNNNFHIDEQVRINNFLESMRKNIEKFKGKQNLLTENCQPIDYIITVGNGLCNNLSFSNNNNDKENSKEEINNL